jgi:MYXO-CTERM domain-containing protein
MANAAVVDLTTTGIFTDPVGGHTTGVGTSDFTWGYGTNGSGPSSLSFDGATAVVNTESGQEFAFGVLEFYNGTIIANSGTSGVDLTVSVDAGVAGDGVQSFDLGIINTPNVGTPDQQADYVSISAELGSADLTIDGESYVLEFLGFGDISSGGFDIVNEFHVHEGATASATLLGRLTPSAAVPELSGKSSGAGLFLALGAIAVLTSRRRRRTG